jgi:hypothetical protein
MSAACTSDMSAKLVGQPCTRSDQCAVSLVCSRGSCVATSSDAGKSDGGLDDDAGGAAGAAGAAGKAGVGK